MRFTPQDSEKYIKGLTRKQRSRWAAIANSVFEACDGKEGAREKAVKIACSKFENASRDQDYAEKHPEFVIPFNPVFRPALESALKKFMQENSDLVEIQEMEIFRTGVHNGEPFEDQDLLQIVENFNNLKNEVRPKLKITHDKEQRTLAGLASYGDIVELFIKAGVDGARRLFARVANVPKQVAKWIEERRFPERSIELYGKLKLGTKNEDKVYRNVLKAVALLGYEMPAVSGMDPVKLSEHIETQNTVCFGEVCFPCEEAAMNYQASLVAASAIAEMLEKKFF